MSQLPVFSATGMNVLVGWALASYSQAKRSQKPHYMQGVCPMPSGVVKGWEAMAAGIM